MSKPWVKARLSCGNVRTTLRRKSAAVERRAAGLAQTLAVISPATAAIAKRTVGTIRRPFEAMVGIIADSVRTVAVVEGHGQSKRHVDGKCFAQSTEEFGPRNVACTQAAKVRVHDLSIE